jgi:hypothetical protein
MSRLKRPNPVAPVASDIASAPLDSQQPKNKKLKISKGVAKVADTNVTAAKPTTTVSGGNSMLNFLLSSKRPAPIETTAAAATIAAPHVLQKSADAHSLAPSAHSLSSRVLPPTLLESTLPQPPSQLLSSSSSSSPETSKVTILQREGKIIQPLESLPGSLDLYCSMLYIPHLHPSSALTSVVLGALKLLQSRLDDRDNRDDRVSLEFQIGTLECASESYTKTRFVPREIAAVGFPFTVSVEKMLTSALEINLPVTASERKQNVGFRTAMDADSFDALLHTCHSLHNSEVCDPHTSGRFKLAHFPDGYSSKQIKPFAIGPTGFRGRLQDRINGINGSGNGHEDYSGGGGGDPLPKAQQTNYAVVCRAGKRPLIRSTDVIYRADASMFWMFDQADCDTGNTKDFRVCMTKITESEIDIEKLRETIGVGDSAERDWLWVSITKQRVGSYLSLKFTRSNAHRAPWEDLGGKSNPSHSANDRDNTNSLCEVSLVVETELQRDRDRFRDTDRSVFNALAADCIRWMHVLCTNHNLRRP